jgi:GntR family transcriptional repressor for pyruvate dehydrogenase complex
MTRLSDRIEVQLEELIASGDLAVGARLPGERALINRLSASRPVIREAISRLESRGLVRVYPSRGTYVTGTPEWGVKAHWQSVVAGDRAKLLSLLEVRECLEVRGAALATERATEEDLAELRLAHMSFEQQAERGSIPDVNHWDKVFHYRLATAAHNEVLASFVENLNSTITTSRRSVFARPFGISRSLDEHRRILEAVEARDADEATAAVAAHIGRVRREIAEITAEQAEAAQSGDGR